MWSLAFIRRLRLAPRALARHVRNEHRFQNTCGRGPRFWEFGTQLTDEIDAFLSGSAREYLEGHHRSVPAWAWINVLAHGARADLEQAASQKANDGSAASLTSFLAVQILSAVDHGGVGLPALQWDKFLPLELAVAERCPDFVPPDAGALARILVATIKHDLASHDT